MSIINKAASYIISAYKSMEEWALKQHYNNTPVCYENYNNLGNNKLTNDDYSIPNIRILEETSPILDRVVDAKSGDLYLSSEDKLFSQIYFIPLDCEIVYKVWATHQYSRLMGTFKTSEAAQAFVHGKQRNMTILKTAQNVFLMLDRNMRDLRPIMFYLSKSRFNANRHFNSMIKTMYPGNAPRFSGIWKLSTFKTSNSSGSWFIPKFEHFKICNSNLLNSASYILTDLISRNIIQR